MRDPLADDSVMALVKPSISVVMSLEGCWVCWLNGWGTVIGESIRLTTESCDDGGVLVIVWWLPNSLIAWTLALRALAVIRS